MVGIWGCVPVSFTRRRHKAAVQCSAQSNLTTNVGLSSMWIFERLRSYAEKVIGHYASWHVTYLSPRKTEREFLSLINSFIFNFYTNLGGLISLGLFIENLFFSSHFFCASFVPAFLWGFHRSLVAQTGDFFCDLDLALMVLIELSGGNREHRLLTFSSVINFSCRSSLSHGALPDFPSLSPSGRLRRHKRANYSRLWCWPFWVSIKSLSL